MPKKVVGSILHGAYGDLYLQATCLKHYALAHPEVDLKLFASRMVRLESFLALDLSFASSFEIWTEIENHPEIEEFFQFQIFDNELQNDVLNQLSETSVAKFDRTFNRLPFVYMREHQLVQHSERYRLGLSEFGKEELVRVAEANKISDDIWGKPTVSFLWRYRKPGMGTISSRGQKTQEEMVSGYSAMFKDLIERRGCHILVCGMNVVTNDENRDRTDCKYPSFGLDLPAEHVTYMQGLSWPLELELASRATACCGNPSGFSEGLWLKRGGHVVLMDAPPHYLAKAIYFRLRIFDLHRPDVVAGAFLSRSAKTYGRRLEAMLDRARA